MDVARLTNDELIQALEDKARNEPLWNTTAQLYAEAASRLSKLNRQLGSISDES